MLAATSVSTVASASYTPLTDTLNIIIQTLNCSFLFFLPSVWVFSSIENHYHYFSLNINRILTEALTFASPPGNFPWAKTKNKVYDIIDPRYIYIHTHLYAHPMCVWPAAMLFCRTRREYVPQQFSHFLLCLHI